MTSPGPVGPVQPGWPHHKSESCLYGAYVMQDGQEHMSVETQSLARQKSYFLCSEILIAKP